MVSIWFQFDLKENSLFINNKNCDSSTQITVVPGQELGEVSTVAVSSVTQTSTTTSTAAIPSTVETNISQVSAPVCSINQEITASTSVAQMPLAAGSLINARPGSMVRVPEMANGRKLIIIYPNISS